jgi:Resolvase, N terminal domain
MALDRSPKLIIGGDMTQVIGYVRCSTREQADSGAGLAAQRAAIQAEADRRVWTVRWVEDAGESGKSMDRPQAPWPRRHPARLSAGPELSAGGCSRPDRRSGLVSSRSSGSGQRSHR